MEAECVWIKPCPRDYQIEAKNGFLYGKYKHSIIDIATGLGKSFAAVMVVDESNYYTLFLAHTDELVRQACLEFILNGIWPLVEKADEYYGTPYVLDEHEQKELFPQGMPHREWFKHGRIVIASRQTFINRMEKYRERPFDLVIIDEVHYLMARQYRKVIDTMLEFNENVRLLGLTATPFRADKKNLCKYFPSDEPGVPAFAYRMSIYDGVCRGYLVMPVGEPVTMKVDSSKWKLGGSIHGRDYTDESLGESMSDPECIESIAYPIVELGGKRKGIVFLPTIATAESVTAALNVVERKKREDEGLQSEFPHGCATFVHGKMPKKERRRRIRAFKKGEYRYMVGVAALTTGFNVRDIEMVVLGRFTKQIGMVIQCVGRGTRTLAGIIDGLFTIDERLVAIADSKKPHCIAEGSRVLTNCGLVPIEKVTREMKVWDGLDFVDHGGVVYKGIRETISYAGLTATEDHNVWTKSGWMPFGQARRSSTEICVTGDAAAPVELAFGHLRSGRATGWESSIPANEVFGVWYRAEQGSDNTQKADSGLSQMWTEKEFGQACSRGAILADNEMCWCKAAVREREVAGLPPVWWSWYKVHVQVSERDGSVDHGQLGRREGQGNRQDGQRRELRGRQPEVVNAIGERLQSEKQAWDGEDARIPLGPSRDSVCGFNSYDAVDKNETDARTGSREVLPEVKQAKRRVWDILNAGPLHRFTCEGLLVSNCKVLDFVASSRHGLVVSDDVFKFSDDEKKDEYIRKNRDKADPRKLRDQVEELEALYALREAIRVAGEPPPKLDYTYREVNLFGGGVKPNKPVSAKDAGRPSSDQIKEAQMFRIKPERAEKMTSGQLKDEIAKRKEQIVGNKNFGWLMSLGINAGEHGMNWHDANYVRKLMFARPDKTLPENWSELMAKNKAKRMEKPSD